MGKYMELLETSTGIGKNVFARFCEYLETAYPSLNDEIQTELRAERGQLLIDDYVRDVACHVVLAEYGAVSRISVAEKKDIETMVATRMEINKEIWKRNLENAEVQLREQLRRNEAKAVLMRSIVEKIRRFVGVNRNRLGGKDFDEWKKNLSKKSDPTTDPNELLSTALDEAAESARDVAERSLRQRRAEFDEKRRILLVVSDVGDVRVVKLVAEIDAVLRPLESEAVRVDAELAARRREALDLRERLAAVDCDLSRKVIACEELVRSLRARLAVAGKRFREIHNETVRWKQHSEQYRTNAERYRSKASFLRQARHIGFMPKGDGRPTEDDDRPKAPESEMLRLPTKPLPGSTPRHTPRLPTKY